MKNNMNINNIDTLCSIIDCINIGVAVIDEQNQVILWNQFMVKHSGINAEDLLGKNLFDVFSYLPKQWLELKFKSVRLIKNYSFLSWTQKPYLFRFNHNQMIAGESIEYMNQDCTFIPLEDPSTGETNICISINNVTDIAISEQKMMEIKDINATLELMTNHDNLTSIYNRSYVEKQISLEFNKAKRYGNIFSIIFFDIDKFKLVNDKFGHLAGDEVLKKISETIKLQLRSSDVFGRYGGEEFFILLPETNLLSSASLSNRLKDTIQNVSVHYDDYEIKTTISLGVVQFRPDIKDYLQMIHEADIALYHSKNSGRNLSSQYKITGCEIVI